jgi:hypothetical protein
MLPRGPSLPQRQLAAEQARQAIIVEMLAQARDEMT